jgi:hypothetical protein
VKKSQNAPSVKIAKPGAVTASTPEIATNEQKLQLHRVHAKGEPKTLTEAIAAASKVPVFAYDPSAKAEAGPVELLQAVAKSSATAAKTKGVELKVREKAEHAAPGVGYCSMLGVDVSGCCSRGWSLYEGCLRGRHSQILSRHIGCVTRSQGWQHKACQIDLGRHELSAMLML